MRRMAAHIVSKSSLHAALLGNSRVFVERQLVEGKVMMRVMLLDNGISLQDVDLLAVIHRDRSALYFPFSILPCLFLSFSFIFMLNKLNVRYCLWAVFARCP